MAKKKKRADGRMQKFFTVNGKRYCVYGTSSQELVDKEAEKRAEILENREKRENPTLDEYHSMWTEARQDSIKDSTLRCQSFQYANCANVRIESAGKRLGDMLLAQIKVDDIREVQRKLKSDGKRTQTVNDAVAHLSHIFHTAEKERRIEYNPCILVKPLHRTEERA